MMIAGTHRLSERCHDLSLSLFDDDDNDHRTPDSALGNRHA